MGPGIQPAWLVSRFHEKSHHQMEKYLESTPHPNTMIFTIFGRDLYKLSFATITAKGANLSQYPCG